jgi:hypothetical protein
MWGWLKRWDYSFNWPVFCRDYTRLRFPLVSTNVAISIKSSPIVYDNHTFRSNLLNYYLPLWNLADSLNPCPGTRTFLVKTEGLGVLSISSLVFLPKELGDFQFNRSETSPFYLDSSINENSTLWVYEGWALRWLASLLKKEIPLNLL